MKFLKNMFFLILLTIIIAPLSAKAIADNALTKLEVETKQGTGNFDLSGGKKNFSFSLASTLSYANIIAEPSNSSYVVTGAGHVNVKEGLNTINVVVTDPTDNSSATYTINLNFKAKGNVIQSSQPASSTDEPNPSTGSFMNYSTISLAAVAGSLLIVKSKKGKRVY